MNEHPIALYLIGAVAIIGAGLLTFNQEQGGATLALASKPSTTSLPWLKSAMVAEPTGPAADVGLNVATQPTVTATPSAAPVDIKPAGGETVVPDPIAMPLDAQDRWAPAAKRVDALAAPPAAVEPTAAVQVDGFIVIGSFTSLRSAEKHAGRYAALAPQVIAMQAGDRPVQRVVVLPRVGEPLQDALKRVTAGGVADAWALRRSAKRRAALQTP